jgi:hypothetical protein
MYDQVMLIVYCILCIIGYFHNIFYNDDAAAVGVVGADLFVGGVIELLLQRIVFYGAFF